MGIFSRNVLRGCVYSAMLEGRIKLTKSLSFLKGSFAAEWMVLIGLFLATMVMLYPLSLNPNEMVPEPADPLLNVWRMHWHLWVHQSK